MLVTHLLSIQGSFTPLYDGLGDAPWSVKTTGLPLL